MSPHLAPVCSLWSLEAPLHTVGNLHVTGYSEHDEGFAWEAEQAIPGFGSNRRCSGKKVAPLAIDEQNEPQDHQLVAVWLSLNFNIHILLFKTQLGTPSPGLPE